MPTGPAPGVGSLRTVTTPRSSRPIALAWFSVNHSASSGPVVIIDGMPPGTASSVTSPSTLDPADDAGAHRREPQRPVGPGA